MVWGYITSKGKFKIYRINGTMNFKKYTELLETKVLDELVNDGFCIKDIMFMQDNASCHTSKASKKWFKDHNLNLLTWPAQSPDMNPIEIGWFILEKNLRKRQVNFNDLDELWKILEEESEKIDPLVIKKLFKSLPARINALKENNFNATKY